METKAETHQALMMTGLIVKASGGFAPGSTSHVQWDQLEYINIGNTDVKKTLLYPKVVYLHLCTGFKAMVLICM